MSDRKLLEKFLRHLHATGALSAPDTDLKGAIDVTLGEDKP